MFKTAKNAISRKKLIIFDFTSFFAHCDTCKTFRPTEFWQPSTKCRIYPQINANILPSKYDNIMPMRVTMPLKIFFTYNIHLTDKTKINVLKSFIFSATDFEP